jgi:hypothetical protein
MDLVLVLLQRKKNAIHLLAGYNLLKTSVYEGKEKSMRVFAPGVGCHCCQ